MYAPTIPPDDPKLLPQWLREEFAAVLYAMQGPQDYAQLRTLYAAPAKPREGMVVKADGTTWNPGGTGAGIYAYVGGAWVKL